MTAAGSRCGVTAAGNRCGVTAAGNGKARWAVCLPVCFEAGGVCLSACFEAGGTAARLSSDGNVPMEKGGKR